MKKLLLLAVLPLLIVSCAPDDSAPASRSAATGRQKSRVEDDYSTPPRIGMTQQEVREKYGRPYSTSVNSKGEVWNYVFNMWDGRDFIPYYGSIHSAVRKRQVGTVVFDNTGRVRDFNWSEQ